MEDTFEHVLDTKLIDLMETTGYNVSNEEPGFRKFGPPAKWEKPIPSDYCEVFIGYLPRDVFEDTLVPLCLKFGTIYEFRLRLNVSGQCKGYAICTYATETESEEAVKHLEDYELRTGQYIRACKFLEKQQLFIQIPQFMHMEAILDEIQKISTGILDVLPSCSDKGNSYEDFAVIEFESHRDAAESLRKINSRKKVLGKFGDEIDVDWTEPDRKLNAKDCVVIFVGFILTMTFVYLLSYFKLFPK